jgi:hypothetical protein
MPEEGSYPQEPIPEPQEIQEALSEKPSKKADESEEAPVAFRTMLPPPSKLIREDLQRYRESTEFKNAFYESETDLSEQSEEASLQGTIADKEVPLVEEEPFWDLEERQTELPQDLAQEEPVEDFEQNDPPQEVGQLEPPKDESMANPPQDSILQEIPKDPAKEEFPQ